MLSTNAFSRLLINPYLDNTSTCASNNLGVSEENETSNINPDFRPNMISVYYEGEYETEDGEINRNFITVNQYDSGLTKPESVPVRQGYKFAGWKITGTRTCEGFEYEESCNSFQQCAWNGTECIKNPCVVCKVCGMDADDEQVCCTYTEYDSETGKCGASNNITLQ